MKHYVFFVGISFFWAGACPLLGGTVFFEKHVGNILAKDRYGNVLGSIRFGNCTIAYLEVGEWVRRQGIGFKLFHKAVKEMRACDVVQWGAYATALEFYIKQGAEVRPGNQTLAEYRRLHRNNPTNLWPLVPLHIKPSVAREYYGARKNRDTMQKCARMHRWHDFIKINGFSA